MKISGLASSSLARFVEVSSRSGGATRLPSAVYDISYSRFKRSFLKSIETKSSRVPCPVIRSFSFVCAGMSRDE